MKRSVGILGILCMVIALVLFANTAEGKQHGVPPPSAASDFLDYLKPNAAKVELGRLLFFDKILSGNKNISCATCHHPLANTGDGLSVSVGEGGQGVGVTRNVGFGANRIHERVPRNAPPIFGLGVFAIDKLFHDGRVAIDDSFPSGFRSPAGEDLPIGLENVLAVQAMFPVTSTAEMAGQAGENPIADAVTLGHVAGPTGVWGLLERRLQAIPVYRQRFEEVYGISEGEITFVHAANAIAAFEIATWRANNTPFDRYLRGEWKVLSPRAKRGMRLFYGKAQCVSCHSGTYLTDMEFHSIAMPQVGPGKGDGFDGHEDFGRERVTGNQGDRYRFRTPPLRNVALTAPYGHSGAFNTLEEVVLHHLNPTKSLQEYRCQEQVVLPPDSMLDPLDCIIQNDPGRVALIAAANELRETKLKPQDFRDLIEFLHALTDPEALDLRKDVPFAVPSGLLIAE